MSEWVPLVDVGDMSLVELLAVVDGPIAEATARILAALDDPDSTMVSGFGSAV